MATRLRNMKINEVSLVDKPANKSAKVVLTKRAEDDFPHIDDPQIWWDCEEFEKRDFSAEERRRDAKSGAAMPDGSFPIHSAKDLHNAMTLAGHSKNPAAARAHIKARAKALGLTAQLSDAYKSETAPAGVAGNAESKDNIMLEAMIKAFGLPAEATEEDVMKAIADRDAKIAEKDAEIAKKAEEAEAGKEEVEKAFSEKLAKAEKRIADLEEKETVAKFAKKAFDLNIETVDGAMVRKAYEGDEKTIAQLFEMLASAHSAVEEAGTFREIGTAKGANADDPMVELNAKAEELQKKQPGMKFDVAFAKVYEDPANAKLVERERAKNRPQ